MRSRTPVRLLTPIALVTLGALATLAGALTGGAGDASAAENFVCGPGGRPDPKTARCTCPAGKAERTSGGTSRCVDAVAPKPTATSAPSSPGAPSTTMTPGPTNAPPTPPLTCPPTQFPTARGCVDRCAAGELYRDHLCVPRCRVDESWNGAACVRATPSPGVPGGPGESARCTEGRVPDTTGHCCFAGQVWGEQSGRCRGAPRCPSGTIAEGETCAIDCEQGMQRAGDGVHCCWPAQEWSGATRECIGVATCPEGYELGPDGCIALRLCEPGKVAVDVDHCCWPGQHWMMRDDGEAGCAGAPACPAPMIAQGDGCFPPGQLRERDDRVERSGDWGAQSLTFEIGYGFASNRDDTRTQAFALGAAWHLAAIPLRLGLGLQFGKTGPSSPPPCTDPSQVCSDPSGSSTTWLANVSFAPFSMPNLAKESSSYLNPFFGLEARMVNRSSQEPVRSWSDRSLGLVVGDAIFFKPVVLTIAGTVTLLGTDARPTATLTLTIGYAAKTSLAL
jgi:hypothetical protein